MVPNNSLDYLIVLHGSLQYVIKQCLLVLYSTLQYLIIP